MKTRKINTEFKFAFSKLLKGLEGGEYVPLEGRDSRWVKSMKAKINLTKLPQTFDVVTLLNDSQITTVFEEECGEMFKTIDDVRNTFTFEARRQHGWIERTKENSSYQPHMFWVTLTRDLGERRAEDASAELSFILSQLVRFGVMDRIQFISKSKTG